jgi:hypothetical protein
MGNEKKKRKTKIIGNYAEWEVYEKNDYIVQDPVEAMVELSKSGFSLLACAIYAVMARRFQLSIWHSRDFKIQNWRSRLFAGDHFIIYPEWELIENFEYMEPSIRRAFKELSDAGYALRFQSGGSDSRVPSKIIIFQLDRPFRDFKHNGKDYWKQVQEKMIEEPGKAPDVIFDEIIEDLNE